MAVRREDVNSDDLNQTLYLRIVMNDITKARYFLKTRNSDLQHLTSFGLMFATAERKYRDVKLRQQGNRDGEGALDATEIETSLDYSVLRYLKRHNRLPPNAADAFKPGVTLKDKRDLARQWITA